MTRLRVLRIASSDFSAQDHATKAQLIERLFGEYRSLETIYTSLSTYWLDRDDRMHVWKRGSALSSGVDHVDHI
jgi:hypothetical protein